jgi:putative FmdB family regulatory protein
MPIYAYRCTSCGHAQDVLQRMSDPVLSVCPACGASTYAKQVTAAGFQLKGSGWYVTDFRGGNNATTAKKEDEATTPAAEGAVAAGDKAADKAAEKTTDKAPSKAPEKAAAPAATSAAPATPAPPAASS